MARFSTFRWLLLAVFAVINGVMLYLFLLQLPPEFEPLIASFYYWPNLNYLGEKVTAVALATGVVGLFLAHRLPDATKNQVLYLKRRHAHPAHQAFFGGREPGFDRLSLMAAYPAVKDSAFAPDVQRETWETLYRKHSGHRVVIGPARTWGVLRDLYLVGVVYLSVFLVSWPVTGAVFGTAAPYLFVFGAQALFLMFSAWRMGWRMVHNVLATEIGIRPGESMDTRKKDKSRKSRK